MEFNTHREWYTGVESERHECSIANTVRLVPAWIGTTDRSGSLVGLTETDRLERDGVGRGCQGSIERINETLAWVGPGRSLDSLQDSYCEADHVMTGRLPHCLADFYRFNIRNRENTQRMEVYEWPGLRHAFGLLDQALFAPAPGLTPLSNGTNSPVFGYKARNVSVREVNLPLNRIVPFHEYIDGFMTGRTLTNTTAREVTGAMLTLMQAAWSRDVYTSYPPRDGGYQYFDSAPNETLVDSHVALLSACTADDDPTQYRALEDFGNTPKLKTDARPFFMVGGTKNLERHVVSPSHGPNDTERLQSTAFARDAARAARDTVTCGRIDEHEDYRLALALLLFYHLSKRFACDFRRPMLKCTGGNA